MKKLLTAAALMLSLSSFAPATSAAAATGSGYRWFVDGYCQADDSFPNRNDVFRLGGRLDAKTGVDLVNHIVMVWREYRDYREAAPGVGYKLFRSERDIARRSIGGVDIDGRFGGSSYYDTQFVTTDYDIKLTATVTFRGKNGRVFAQKKALIAEKPETGQCMSYRAGHDPV